MLATLITLSRFPLLGFVLVTLYRGGPATRLIGVVVLALGLLLDTVDGVVARQRNETSLGGGVLDIAADRTYELVLWLCFANLGLIPVIIPVLVVARTTLTDAFRSLGVRDGIAPFDQLGHSLAGRLVASSWMRTGYGVSKGLAFGGLALAAALPRGIAGVSPEFLIRMVHGLAWVATSLCLIRGAPVIADGLRRLWPATIRRTPLLQDEK